MRQAARLIVALLLSLGFASVQAQYAISALTSSPIKSEDDRIRQAMQQGATKGWRFAGMRKIASRESSSPPWSEDIKSLTNAGGYAVLFEGEALVPNIGKGGSVRSSNRALGSYVLTSFAQSGKDDPSRGSGKDSPGNYRPATRQSRFQVWVVAWPGQQSLPEVKNNLRQTQMMQRLHPVLLGYDKRYLLAAMGDLDEGEATLFKIIQSLKLTRITEE